MLKKILFIALIAICIKIKAQSFSGNYPFSLVTNSSGTVDPTSVPTATGVAFGSFSANGVSANSNATVRFSFTSWPIGATSGVDTYSAMTGSINLGKYYEVTLTPINSYSISLTSITFNMRRSGTGVRNYAVRSSVDSYAANLPASVSSNTNLSVVGTNNFFWNFDATSTSADQVGSTITVSGPDYTYFVNPITFRFYAWNCENNSLGTFSIDNVTFNGSALSLPNCTFTTAASHTAICSGSSATLSASGSLTGYFWSPVGLSGGTIVVSPTVSTVYTVLGSGPSCNSSTATISLIVNDVPSLSLSPLSQTLCVGETATITASGADTYSWSPFGGVASTETVSPLADQTYTILGTNSCGTSSATAAIVITTVTVINAVSSNSSICSGQSVTLTATGATSYTWSPNNFFTSSIIISPSVTTVYTITGESSCGTGTTTITQNVTQNPLVGISVSGSTFCANTQVDLIASGTATNYTWQPGSSNSSSITIFPSVSTTYTVIGEDSGCTTTETVSLNIIQNPTLNTSISNNSICEGSQATLEATGTAVNYTWLPGSLNSSSITVSPSVSTIYTVTGEDLGCTTTETINLSIIQNPTITISSSSSTLCVGQSATLIAIGATSYTWSTTETTSDIVVTPTLNTAYALTGEDLGCTSTNTIDLFVNPTPTVLAISSVSAICVGENALLTALSNASDFIWSTTATTMSTSISPTVTTTYSVVVSIGSCSASSTVNVVVNACTAINEFNSSQDITIYPNPNETGILYIENTSSSRFNKIEIIDILGNVILLNANEINLKTKLNLSSFPNGNYFIRMYFSDNTIATQRIVLVK
jgi:hypothetical protein